MFICSLLVCPWRAAAADETAGELDAQRLIGKAYYENAETPPQFEPAVQVFRRCIELAPDSAADRFNLGLTLMRAEEFEQALQVLGEARRLDPDLLAAAYVSGIVQKRLSQPDQAIRQLEHVTARDPSCMGAFYNLGICYKLVNDYDKAIAAFKRAVEIQPAHPSAHFQLMTLYRRLGQVDNVHRHKEIFDQIKDTVDESEKTAEALERSRYSYIIQPPKLMRDLTPLPDAGVRFSDATGSQALPEPDMQALPDRIERAGYDEGEVRKQYAPHVGGAVALNDFDADGDLDVYVVRCAATPERSANRLYRNERQWRFEDVTEAFGVGETGLGTHAVFGDYDNDGDNDLYVVNAGPNVLYRNPGDGPPQADGWVYQNVSEDARCAEPQFGRKAVWFDYDHDNDLDLFIVNDVDLANPPDRDTFTLPDDFEGQLNTLLRNNGNGTFSDQTDQANLLIDSARTVDVLFADFDADDDADLFVVNADTPSRLLANARFGRFEPGGTFDPPLAGPGRAAAERDFNHDGTPDLIFAAGKQVHLYTNDGQARFSGKPIALPAGLADGVGDVDLIDYNNDGWCDLLLTGADGSRLGLLAATGPGEFRDVSAAVGLDASFGRIADAAVGDLDGDGDEDIALLTRDRGLRLLRNDGGEKAHGFTVRLVGKKVNRNGYGATVEIASGGHYQRQTLTAGPVHFGLGNLDHLDVVRVTWPNGQAQNVIRPDISQELEIVQYVKVSASCGFLYAYNGQRFELVNEILGIGPLGVPMAPGVYYPLDNTELTKIAARQLAASDGFYELRLTEELREITYADQITLRVVDHPAELELIPNEMFSSPPPEDRFYAVGDHRPPAAAVDDGGRDVRELVCEHDGRFPTFPLVARYDGLAEPHALTLDLGDLSQAETIMLFLDCWIYWPESSVSMAIGQDPRYALAPLELEVRNAQGQWQTAIDSVGLPTSKGLVVPVDLTGRFAGEDYHVRLSTNLCVYFDRIFVSTDDRASSCRVTELPAATADLHYRGFSAMTRDDSGYERFDYTRVNPVGSWNPPRGMFTRYGDVTPLLAEPDNRYVIFGPGDQMTMRFDARSLPEPPAGWTRDFIFYANGWVKDGDLNTKFSDTVEPLPFHGMSGYPYGPDEHYPDTPELQDYLRTYNTRPSLPTVGPLTTGRRLVGQPASGIMPPSVPMTPPARDQAR